MPFCVYVCMCVCVCVPIWLQRSLVLLYNRSSDLLYFYTLWLFNKDLVLQLCMYLLYWIKLLNEQLVSEPKRQTQMWWICIRDLAYIAHCRNHEHSKHCTIPTGELLYNFYIVGTLHYKWPYWQSIFNCVSLIQALVPDTQNSGVTSFLIGPLANISPSRLSSLVPKSINTDINNIL